MSVITNLFHSIFSSERELVEHYNTVFGMAVITGAIFALAGIPELLGVYAVVLAFSHRNAVNVYNTPVGESTPIDFAEFIAVLPLMFLMPVAKSGAFSCTQDPKKAAIYLFKINALLWAIILVTIALMVASS